MTGIMLSRGLAAATVIFVLVAEAKSSNDTHQLLDRLFANYSVLVRPVKNENQPTLANVVFTIEQLESVDIKTQTMRSLGYFSINWTDEYLTWNPEDYGGIKYISVPEVKIWTPDYVIDNDAGGKKQMGGGSSLVIIESSGQILWEPAYIATTLCTIDITYFPFDQQTCTVELTSWMTPAISLQTNSTQGLSLSAFIENGEFEVLGTRALHTKYPMTYKRNEMLEGISFMLILKRRTIFYWLCLVSPLIVFPFMSPLSFLVPADSGEKTTLAITALLSVFVFMGIVYDIMPRLSNTVSYFVLLASAQVFVSLFTVVCNVIILCIGRLSTDRKVPAWLETLITSKSQKKRSGEEMNCVDNDTIVQDVSDQVTWGKVARYLDKVCFIISLTSVSAVTIVIGALVLAQ